MSDGGYRVSRPADDIPTVSPRGVRGGRGPVTGPGPERASRARPPAGPRGQFRRGGGRTLHRRALVPVAGGGLLPPAAADPARIIREDAAAVAAGLAHLGDATVLVTGTTDILGVYLTAVLEAAGARVVTAERRGNALVLPSDPVDHVIHAAWPTDPDTFSSDIAAAMVGNTAVLTQLLDHARTHGAHVTFVSTIETSRLDLTDSRSFYPAAGRAAEALCAAYRQQYAVPTSIIRLAHVYGPGFSADTAQVWAEFTRAAVSGDPIVVRSSDNRRLPWTYVADAADAVLRTALTHAERDTTLAFEAVDERARCDIRAFARTALDKAGRPPALAYQLSSPQRPAAASPQPLRRADRPPGWGPRTRLVDGIERTVRWYRAALATAPAEAMAASGR